MKTQPSQDYEAERLRMVETQIEARGVSQPEVLDSLRTVPRHLLLAEGQRRSAYQDHPLHIGEGQTISQPYIVALMTEVLELEEGDRVLEIGTGSGYQAAVLSRIVRKVYSIEIIGSLSERAAEALEIAGYDNVELRVGDGWIGWPEEAPFDGIMLTAAPREIPPPLIDQLKLGGKLVAPVGDFYQELVLITKTKDGFERRRVDAVRFVPMTGEASRRKPPD